MTQARPVIAPLALAAVVLAAAPATASLMGVDSLRGWLGLARGAGAVVRCTLLAYSILVAANALRRTSVASGLGLLTGTITALLVESVFAGLAAVVWSSLSSPVPAADAQEWLLLFAAPSAAGTALVASTGVLLLGRGVPPQRWRGFVDRGAAALAIVGVFAYLAMRAAGLPSLPRVAVPVSVAAALSALLVAVAFDGTRSLLARIALGTVGGAVVVVLGVG